MGNRYSTLRSRLSVLNPLRTSDGSSTVEVTHLAHGYAGGETVVIEDASAVGGINTGSLNGTRTVAGIIDENTWYFTAGGSASSARRWWRVRQAGILMLQLLTGLSSHSLLFAVILLRLPSMKTDYAMLGRLRSQTQFG